MIIILLVAFIILILEKGIFPAFIPTGYIPQLLLLFLLMYARYQRKSQYISTNMLGSIVFISGILFDLLSGNTLGITSLSLLLTVFILAGIRTVIPLKEDIVMMPVEISIGTVLYNIQIILYTAAVRDLYDIPVLESISKSLLANLLIGLIIYPVAVFIFRRLFGEKEVKVIE